jgi:hypothetical protein
MTERTGIDVATIVEERASGRGGERRGRAAVV